VLPRFYAPDLDPSEPRVRLSPSESQHLARVMRLPSGARVRVFDGRGREFVAHVHDASARAAVLALEHAVAGAAELPFAVTLAQALLKGDSMDTVVRDATTAGVTRITPLVTSRTNVSPRLLAGGKAQERWQRVAVASAKQCGRAVVPVIDVARPLTEVVTTAQGTRLMLAEPSLDAASQSLPERPDVEGVILLVGPEGGWTDKEREVIVGAGWATWSFAPWTLRAETAAFAALSILQYQWRAPDKGETDRWAG
jgi:16S rRNA (uracil1498-N3)-methyltransferase